MRRNEADALEIKEGAMYGTNGKDHPNERRS
jgi:hypothetical protein